MRARIVDPVGPLWSRALPYLAAALLVGSACAFTAAALPLLALAATAFFLAPWLVGRRRMREAELLLGPGYVDVKRAGLLSQRIDARAIMGASTARLEDGVGLALQRRRKDRAISLLVASDAEAHAIRDALGIGHNGFGEVRWILGPTGRVSLQELARVGGWLGTAGSIVAAAVELAHVHVPFELTSLLPVLAPMGVLGTLVFVTCWVVNATTMPRHLMLRADGVHGYFPGWHHFPYGAVANAEMDGDALVLTLHGTMPPIRVPVGRRRFAANGTSHEELTQLRAQLISAAQRAQGAGPEKPGATTRVDLLARGHETRREWLARLDAAAAAFASGYRGAGLDEEDLWTTLRDPDAPAHLRAGAARVLWRVAPAKAPAQVASVLATVRAAADEATIRDALADDDEAEGPDLRSAGRSLRL
jgi:hypothetical protein